MRWWSIYMQEMLLMIFMKKGVWLNLAIASGVALLLSACGGSSSDSSNGSSSTTVTGSIFAAPVSGASVTVKDIGGNIIAGPATTNASGQYSVSIPNANLAQDLVFESSGGSFADEATGASTTAGNLTAYVAANSLSAGAQIHATPGSTIVERLITQHSMTQAQAENAFQNAFAYIPDISLAPTDATNPDAGAADDQKLAGLRAAVFSQLASDLGLTAAEQFQLIQVLAQDLTDGEMDGVDASGVIMVPGTAIALQADIRNRFAKALENFRAGNDHSGLSNDQLGALPFAKIALSNSYRFEYVEGMMAATEGKTLFKLRVTDAATGTTPQTGLSLSLMAMMHMATMTHSTPDADCVESATAGTYDCTIYYLMPSQMMNTSMGYWQLTVMAGMNESAVFYPTVTMAMNGNGKVVLKGQSGDLIAGMTGTENRSYYIFKDSVSGATDNHTIKLFVAARESMMSFPAIYAGKILNQGTAYELNFAAMSVEVSTDGSTWVAADGSSNDGYWTASGVSGLTDGVEGSFFIRVTINGEQKTTDGAIPAGDGSNDYTTITFTP
jgi:hypothetical protein